MDDSSSPLARALARQARAPARCAPLVIERLRARRGLEIGGPSAIFTADAKLPVYPVIGSLDNLVFAHHTVWHDTRHTERFVYAPQRPAGRQMIGEGGNPDVLDGARYDCLLSSHTLEHLANPIGALLAWKRLLRPDACLLLVVPHRDRSFDRRRPITDFTHLLEDFHSGVGEDDMTHVEEALKLHDYQWGDGTDRRAFREALRENFDRRTLHHHVFDTELVGRIVDFAGFQLRALEPCPLFHVIAVGELTSAGADNTEFLGSSAAWRRESPFPSDRRVATV